jgi:hypothetical protein
MLRCHGSDRLRSKRAEAQSALTPASADDPAEKTTALISIVGSPLAGAAYDFSGMRPLYAVAVVGYLLGWLSLYVTYQRRSRQAKPTA